MRTIFVAGLSGAGRSQAIKTFEDLGYSCIEHLPPVVLDETLDALAAAETAAAVIHVELYGDERLGDPIAAIERVMRERGAELLFLDARDEVLVRRFSATRRRHPRVRDSGLLEAIAEERAALSALRERASLVIDTSDLTHGQLTERIARNFSPDQRGRLDLTVIAFGFKYGVPIDLDLLFDVRFLRNPNYEPALASLTGNDAAVAAFVSDDPSCAPFLAKTIDLLDFLMPRYIAEGKTHLAIGIGCTGGRHRSVYVARRLLAHFESDQRLRLAFEARDVSR
jgi:UPF0042 nucleotide-binding protein